MPPANQWKLFHYLSSGPFNVLLGRYQSGHCPDIPWFLNNINRVEFINGDIELFPGIKCVLAPGHTGGHQHVEVQSEDGKAIIVDDTVYDIPFQLEERAPGRTWPPGNCWNQALIQDQLLNLKWELKRGSLILPSHSWEVLDRLKLRKRRSDKYTDYEGFSSLDWPPKMD